MMVALISCFSLTLFSALLDRQSKKIDLGLEEQNCFSRRRRRCRRCRPSRLWEGGSHPLDVLSYMRPTFHFAVVENISQETRQQHHCGHDESFSCAVVHFFDFRTILSFRYCWAGLGPLLPFTPCGEDGLSTKCGHF